MGFRPWGLEGLVGLLGWGAFWNKGFRVLPVRA